MLCKCGKEATKTKNNKWFCDGCYEKYIQFCERQRQNALNVNNKEKIICPICKKEILISRYTQHIRSCKKKYKSSNTQIEIDNKYSKWYNNIIEYRKNNPLIKGYKERHHIIPRSCKGSNDKENLIYLTAREHFICHLLLVEIYRNTKYYSKLLHAVILMKADPTSNRYINARLYEKYKIEYSKIRSITGRDENNNSYGKKWIHNDKLKQSKLVKKEQLQEYFDNGWKLGCVREGYWELHFNKVKIKIKKERIISKEKAQELLKNKIDRENRLKERIKKLEELYKIYSTNNWKDFVKLTGYKYSWPCFVAQCKKHVKDFKSYNHTKRILK